MGERYGRFLVKLAKFHPTSAKYLHFRHSNLQIRLVIELGHHILFTDKAQLSWITGTGHHNWLTGTDIQPKSVWNINVHGSQSVSQ